MKPSSEKDGDLAKHPVQSPHKLFKHKIATTNHARPRKNGIAMSSSTKIATGTSIQIDGTKVNNKVQSSH